MVYTVHVFLFIQYLDECKPGSRKRLSSCCVNIALTEKAMKELLLRRLVWQKHFLWHKQAQRTTFIHFKAFYRRPTTTLYNYHKAPLTYQQILLQHCSNENLETKPINQR